MANSMQHFQRSNETLYRIPAETAYGLKEEFNGRQLSCKKSTILAAYLSRDADIVVCACAGKSSVAVELGIEPSHMEIC